MKSPVRFRKPARADVLDEFVFLEEASPGAGDRFLQAVDQAARLLSDRPLLGRSDRFPNTSLRGVRSWPVPGFERMLILYRPRVGRIEVLRVVHGARNLSVLSAEEE